MPLLVVIGKGAARASGIFQGIPSEKMTVRGRYPRREIFGKRAGKGTERSRQPCGHQAPGTRTHAPPLLCHSPAGAGNGPENHTGVAGPQRHQDNKHLSSCNKCPQVEHTKSA